MKSEIQKELQNGVSINEICNKYKITFDNLFKMLHTKGGTGKKRNYHSNTSELYIVKQGRRYLIMNSHICYGRYFSLDEAKLVRDYLVGVNWNVNPRDYLGDAYIQIRKNKGYLVKKQYQGNPAIKCGVYKTLKDARKVRDFMDKHDWDIKYLHEIQKEVKPLEV